MCHFTDLSGQGRSSVWSICTEPAFKYSSVLCNTEQERIIGKLAARLAKAGLEGIRISAPEENSIEQTIKSFSSYDNDVKSKIGQLNTHTYNGKSRKELKQLAERHGKKLWMSEVSLGGTEEHNHEDMTGALELARRIVDDINGMETAMNAAPIWTKMKWEDF